MEEVVARVADTALVSGSGVQVRNDLRAAAALWRKGEMSDTPTDYCPHGRGETRHTCCECRLEDLYSAVYIGAPSRVCRHGSLARKCEACLKEMTLLVYAQRVRWAVQKLEAGGDVLEVCRLLAEWTREAEEEVL